MRFLIYRVSRKPIGEIKLLEKVIFEDDENEYGIVEINSIEDLPKEDFIVRYSLDSYPCVYVLNQMGFSESYVNGVILLYDDYI